MNINYVKTAEFVRNWGDCINVYIYNKLSEKSCKVLSHTNTNDEPHYVICGSIMHFTTRNSIVWGAGLITNNVNYCIDHKIWVNKKIIPKKICAVRGPKTRQELKNIGIDCPNVYGDPAMIFPFLYNPINKKKYKYGIIPHYIDKNDNNVKKISSLHNVKMIDICIKKNDTIQTIIDEISECDVIFSSTLHGFILGELYSKKKKSFYVRFGNRVSGGDFKYKDHMESIGRDFYKMEPNQLYNILTGKIILEEQDYYNYTKKFDYTKYINSCPFINKDVKEKMIIFFQKYKL